MPPFTYWQFRFDEPSFAVKGKERPSVCLRGSRALRDFEPVLFYEYCRSAKQRQIQLKLKVMRQEIPNLVFVARFLLRISLSFEKGCSLLSGLGGILRAFLPLVLPAIAIHTQPAMSPSPDSMNRRLPRKQQNAHQRAITDLALSAKSRRAQFDQMRQNASPQSVARVEHDGVAHAEEGTELVSSKQGSNPVLPVKERGIESLASVQNPEAALSDEDNEQESTERRDVVGELPRPRARVSLGITSGSALPLPRVTLDVPSSNHGSPRGVQRIPPTPREFDFASAVAEQLASAGDSDMAFSLSDGAFGAEESDVEDAVETEDVITEESKEVSELEILAAELEERSKKDAAEGEVEKQSENETDAYPGIHESPESHSEKEFIKTADHEILRESPKAHTEQIAAVAPLSAELSVIAGELALQTSIGAELHEKAVSPEAINDTILSKARAPHAESTHDEKETRNVSIFPTNPQSQLTPLPARSQTDVPPTHSRISLPPVPKSDRKRVPSSQRLPRAHTSSNIPEQRSQVPRLSRASTDTLQRRHVRALSQIPESSIRRSPTGTSNEKISLPPLPAVVGNRRRPRRHQRYKSTTLTLPLNRARVTQFGMSPPLSAVDAATPQRPKRVRARSLSNEAVSPTSALSAHSSATSDEHDEKVFVTEVEAAPAAPVTDMLKH